jgi:membrane associated rhomboid family serine protease
MFQPDRPRRREPIFNLPGLTLLLMAAMLAVHAIRIFLPEETSSELVIDYGFTPLRLWLAFDPGYATRLIEEARNAGRGAAPETEIIRAAAGYFGAAPATALVTPVTYALLHGDWTHVVINAVWLAAFGSAIEKRIGKLRYLVMFVVGAAAGALLQALVEPAGVAPLIGASASVSACFGAAARFIFWPEASGPHYPPYGQARLARCAPLAVVFRDRRSLGFIALWLALNLLVGILAEPLGISGSPIAWVAHLGGFAVGLFGLPLFEYGRD